MRQNRNVDFFLLGTLTGSLAFFIVSFMLCSGKLDVSLQPETINSKNRDPKDLLKNIDSRLKELEKEKL
ncbi:hypothetical protein V4762_09415 [Thermodesulfobium sp. 4217-1]|uniref:hypothetical protein n=1 Tax=Thermodesulfobium sp. 4217-1 TaxID=3120013 RepID=UPI0032214E31